ILIFSNTSTFLKRDSSTLAAGPNCLMSDFDEIYRAYAAPVYRLALRAVSRHDVAEDITSEVFLAFRDQCNQIPREQLPAWLFTVAKRRCADHWRRSHLAQR